MSNSRLPTADRRSRLRDFGARVVAGGDPGLRRKLIAATAVLVVLIGVADFLTGTQASFLAFYCVPVALATAAVGWRFGGLVAVVSVATWLAGDFAAGARYPNPLIPGWNALIAVATYFVVIWLLSSLLSLHRDMEARVRQRTAALTEEIAERERLERVVLEIGDRERRSVGRDLHDGLGQHLTGTALVAQALAASLAERRAGEADEMRKIVALVEQGIEQTRRLAKGLLLAEIESDGLAPALHELAAATRQDFRIACECECHGSVDLGASGVATHLYRIAQEAVRNAVRHGRPTRIAVRLKTEGGTLRLSVLDDGIGLPPTGRPERGLGLRIMAHRAAILGAQFSVEARPEGGTVVSCVLPLVESA